MGEDKANPRPLEELLREIYHLTQNLELGCGELGCFLCAKGGNRVPECNKLREAVVLLPGENALIRELNGSSFPEVSFNGMSVGFLAPEQDCPFNREGWCGIHGKHPIDCRSYPIVPSLNERGDLIISISVKCPATPSWNFVKTWVEVWRELWEVLPEEWFRFYSEVPNNQLKPIVRFKVEEKRTPVRLNVGKDSTL